MGKLQINGDINFTGAMTTPGNDTIVIKPAKNNYDQIGGSDCKFWKVYASTFYGSLSGNADTASKLATARTISLTGSVTGSGTFDGSGNLSIATTTNHTHNYLPLSGGTMSGSPVIKFPASAGSVATSDPMAITYGRISAYGTLCINANTDNSGTEYVILTAGKGLSSSTSDGLAIGTSTLTWQGATVLTSSNFPAASSLARQTDTWISASSLDVNTYYPVVIDIPYQGLCRIKLAVQLNSGTKPSWSTHNGGFTSNIDVEIIAAGWGTVSSNRYLLRQDDYNFSNVKPAYFAGQLSNASKAVFYVRGGGSYRFICDWQDASMSLRTSSSSYNSQTVEPTTSTSVFHSGSKSHLYCNVDYASSAGNADTLDGSHASAFASASHSHSYLPLSGGTLTGQLQVNAPIFGYNYGNSNNAAAFIFDKPSSNCTGIGACGQNDMIHFGPCNSSGTWVSNYNQIWRFQGGVYATGWLESDNYGSGDPGTGTAGYGRGGAVYFKIIG